MMMMIHINSAIEFSQSLQCFNVEWQFCIVKRWSHWNHDTE